MTVHHIAYRMYRLQGSLACLRITLHLGRPVTAPVLTADRTRMMPPPSPQILGSHTIQPLKQSIYLSPSVHPALKSPSSCFVVSSVGLSFLALLVSSPSFSLHTYISIQARVRSKSTATLGNIRSDQLPVNQHPHPSTHSFLLPVRPTHVRTQRTHPNNVQANPPCPPEVPPPQTSDSINLTSGFNSDS